MITAFLLTPEEVKMAEGLISKTPATERYRKESKIMDKYKCSFCGSLICAETMPSGWGRAILEIPNVERVDITFCPIHRAEAEEKLDLIFNEASL